MKYRMIALDLDGTLLNSRKEIPEKTAKAVRRVTAAGIIAAFDTGRALCELRDVLKRLPEVRYAVFASGAGLYDAREERVFGLREIPRDQADSVFALVRGKDLMPQIVLKDRDVIQASHMADLAHFHMEVYRPLYEQAMTLVPDIYAFAAGCREEILKINLYHADPPERIRTREQLSFLDAEKVLAEVSSLELSARGVDKGSGLERLCGILGLSLAECAAAGDADNDIPMLRAAGLGIAMGNAADHVKAEADRVVADLDYGGCAEAILSLLE